MEKNEYKSGQNNNQKHGGPPMGGPHGGVRGGEKAKDLIGTWKKLFGYCRKYMVVFIIALLCAAAGTVLTLMGPDKLSEMTDVMTDGIAPDTKQLENLMKTVSENVSQNMETIMSSITTNISDKEKMAEKAEEIATSSDIPDEDKAAFQQILMDMSENQDAAVMQGQLLSLPESILEILFADIEVNGIRISTGEQVKTLQLLGNLEEEDAESMKDTLDELPASVYHALYTDIELDGVTISGNDQIAMMNTFDDLKEEDTESALEAMDSLPDSVYSLIKPSIDMDKIFYIGMTLVVFYVLSFLLSTVQGLIMATMTQKVSREMRSDISHKINRLPMWFYNRTTTGDVLSRVTNDVDTISQSLNQSFGNLIHAVILFIGSFIMMLVTDLTMTLTAVVASLLGFIVMFTIMGRSQKYFARQQKHLGEINGHIEEMYTGHTVVKAYNGEEDAEKVFDEMNGKLCESGFRAQCMSGLMMPIMNFIGNLGYVAVCVVGGALALNGNISFGVIVAFMMYVRYFTQPLSQIAQAVQSLQSAAAAGERVFEFLEAEEMENESEKIKDIGKTAGHVEFKHVKFGYEDSDTTIIHDFSAEARPGQKVAIVGPTGAGKTTLINLLMRFHEIQSGEICIDGKPINKLTRESVHSQFCMVLQDTWLFEGTVRENLIYCTEGVTDEKMKAACKAVGLDHFIRTLPKGYDTVLNDQVNLSQGQKQQLTIARAMIADKPMLILDEATSSVDTRTELQIQKAMDQLMENRTSFVIAHRLSTIKNADLILVLKDGDIIESGTHEELLEKKGFYADLYNSQFEQAS